MEPEDSRVLAGKDYERPPRTPQEAADELTALSEELGLYDTGPEDYRAALEEARYSPDPFGLRPGRAP